MDDKAVCIAQDAFSTNSERSNLDNRKFVKLLFFPLPLFCEVRALYGPGKLFQITLFIFEKIVIIFLFIFFFFPGQNPLKHVEEL